MPAVLAGTVAIPKAEVANYQALVDSLTLSYTSLGADEAVEILAYREDATHLYMPRQFGISYCNQFQIPLEDATSLGDEVLFPCVPGMREGQAPVLEELVEKCQSFYDYIFRARTGFGKTVVTCLLGARLGRRMLVVVDQENLADQWVETLTTLFGVEKVGRIQGSVCDVVDYPVSVAMVQTLASRRLDDWVYNYFGFIAFDEVHTAGAPTFSRALMDFSAAYRIGVSATPRRRDTLQKLLDMNLGKVRVFVADAHGKSSVVIRKHATPVSWYANKAKVAGRYISELAEDGARNLLIAESAVMLLESGRDTLVLGDRIEQLVQLHSLCYYLGVPEEVMGVYTGRSYAFGWQRNTSPARRPPGWERDAPFTPVKYDLVEKKVPKASLQQIKNEARLIFATYQMFSKGVDVPRLAGGVDASPRGQAEQVHGRILRVQDGKPVPIWITLADENSYRSLFQLVGRLADYEVNNAALYVEEEGEYTPCEIQDATRQLRERVKGLKSVQIETPYAGLHTVRFPGWRVESETRPVPPTRRKTPYRR